MELMATFSLVTESESRTSFPILLNDESDRCRGNPFCHIHVPVFDSCSDFGMVLFRIRLQRSLWGSEDQVLKGLHRRVSHWSTCHSLREYNVQRSNWPLTDFLTRVFSMASRVEEELELVTPLAVLVWMVWTPHRWTSVTCVNVDKGWNA